jgi:RNA polymerase sigma-70 factor, ECF subfamily
MPTSLDRDRDLLTALLEREPTAAEALIDAYGDRAYRLALRITGNVQDAEEVVQDALCVVIWKIGGFRGESAFGTSRPTQPAARCVAGRGVARLR